MQVIRWGIVGPGNIARKFADALANVPAAELKAVASRSAERGTEFAKKYGIPLVFDGYEAMAQSSEVDAVYIATPHPFHFPCAELFIKAKKHILCEKPLCVNAKEAEALRDAARENGVFLMEAMWTRFLPAIQQGLEIAQSGRIGEIMGIKADFCYSLTPQQEPKIFQKEMAGGSLLDVGVYCLHFADLFLGAPETILPAARLEYGVDCHTNLLLNYKSGAIASLSSATTLEKPADAYVYGTKGHLYFPDFYGAQAFYLCNAEGEIRIGAPSIGKGFEEEILEACACIREGRGESETLPLSKTIEILRQMDEIRAKIGVKYPFDERGGQHG